MRCITRWESLDMAPAGDPEATSPEPTSPEPLPSGLYITATPIGNARDITLRALSVLRNCDAIVAEDTRMTSRLLSIYAISRPLLIYNDHNASAMRPKLLRRLRDGQSLAVVTDAGTPLISDPGYRLVRAAREEGLPVIPIPGPSAVTTALSGAGIPCDQFFFAGFLPVKVGERQTALNALRSIPATLVFFESPHRIADSLSEMATVLGNRDAAVARELTKIHEEIRRGTLPELAAYYAASIQVKGEIVVLVAPPSQSPGPDFTRIDSLLQQALPFMPVKAAATLVAEATDAPRRDVYLRALALGERDGRDQ
jgi:16S rRNA (cytidine1402-2'-O)-methyltransferase